MGNRRVLTNRLVSILRELERERSYHGLKRYVRSLKRKGFLNGKQKFILRGATARLKRLQADRRASSLGLTEYIPHDYQEAKLPDVTVKTDFRAWDTSLGIIL
jgi:hypothetical protein